MLKLPYPLILASQSPRRRQLLSQIGLTYSILPANIDEDAVSLALPPQEYVRELSKRKALYIREEIGGAKAIILGADTIVVIDGRILNKPTDPDDAFLMLKQLSNRMHEVFTGITLVESHTGNIKSEVQRTEVYFRELDDEEIRQYIASGSPMDKAGAYGIQEDYGAVFVSKINGCYYNVVGLPLEKLYGMLK
ncbi:MAG: Maf family protein [Ignavibacteria bacterium]|jgi:septum formation protein